MVIFVFYYFLVTLQYPFCLPDYLPPGSGGPFPSLPFLSFCLRAVLAPFLSAQLSSPPPPPCRTARKFCSRSSSSATPSTFTAHGAQQRDAARCSDERPLTAGEDSWLGWAASRHGRPRRPSLSRRVTLACEAHQVLPLDRLAEEAAGRGCDGCGGTRDRTTTNGERPRCDGGPHWTGLALSHCPPSSTTIAQRHIRRAHE